MISKIKFYFLYNYCFISIIYVEKRNKIIWGKFYRLKMFEVFIDNIYLFY